MFVTMIVVICCWPFFSVLNIHFNCEYVRLMFSVENLSIITKSSYIIILNIWNINSVALCRSQYPQHWTFVVFVLKYVDERAVKKRINEAASYTRIHFSRRAKRLVIIYRSNLLISRIFIKLFFCLSPTDFVCNELNFVHRSQLNSLWKCSLVTVWIVKF